MSYAAGMTKDVVVAFCVGLTTAVAGFFATASAVDWYYFRNIPEDATRGITDAFYGAGGAIALGTVCALFAFIWQTKRRHSTKG